MSLIGTLEQIDLANVLQRVEAYAKTGMCVIRQGAQWVELYFGEGRLICIGPIRADATLGERLVEAGVISPQALQAALGFVEAEEFSEMRLALTLIDLGYVDRETLRSWAEQQAIGVLQLLFMGSTGEIYFEEHIAPPAHRLVVALSITSLLASSANASVSSHAENEVSVPISAMSGAIQEQTKSAVSIDLSDAPTLYERALFFPEVSPAIASPVAQRMVLPQIELADTVSLAVPVSLPKRIPSAPQEQVMLPRVSGFIDTSFMQSDMVLVPADLSGLSEQNPRITLTPEQWQILARADSQTSLQMVCQVLGWRPEIVCRVAGELIAEGLLHVVPPMPEYVQELSLTAQTFTTPSMSAEFSGSVPADVSQVSQLNNPMSVYGDVYAYAGVGDGR